MSERDVLEQLLTEVQRLTCKVDALHDQLAGRRRSTNNKEESELVTADELARRLDVTPDWVYRHANRLGVRRLSDRKGGAIRFDPALVLRRLEEEAQLSAPVHPPADPEVRSRSRRAPAKRRQSTFEPITAPRQEIR